MCVNSAIKEGSKRQVLEWEVYVELLEFVKNAKPYFGHCTWIFLTLMQ